MSYYRKPTPDWNIRHKFQSGNSPLTYGAVVGTVDTRSDRAIQGRNGDHLQFYLNTAQGESYQVDVNTQSRDGSDIGVYIAEELLEPAADATTDNPFGAEVFGANTTAQLSYRKLGLADGDFDQLSYIRIENQLAADLAGTRFVTAYGMMFDDGGPHGKGVHDIHYNLNASDQDGALALYKLDADTQKPKRIWYFFKFQDETIASGR
jgi:hypothetical protein